MIKTTINSLPTSKNSHGAGFIQEPLDRPLPACVGVDCPDHPTYPLVWRDDRGQYVGWCRRGQHLVPISVSPDERYIWVAGMAEWLLVSGES